MQQTYPDISNLFAAKAQRRLALAALSWEAKVAILEQMRLSLPKNAWKTRSAKPDTQKMGDQRVRPIHALESAAVESYPHSAPPPLAGEGEGGGGENATLALPARASVRNTQ